MTVLAAFPVDDWQFWVATALAAGCVWLVLRPLLPRRAKSSKPHSVRHQRARPRCRRLAVQPA